MNRLRALALALAALAAPGCGNSEPTGPKENLDDQQKQQVKEFQEQRQDEWGKAPKKGK